MFLRSQGEVVCDLQDSLPELKDLVTESIGQPIRRISRFMQLALIGAGRCGRNASVPKDTAVYLASSRGDLEITIDVVGHVFCDGQAPKPLSFVNTVSNSAAFYVAKCLRLESRSAFVCSRYFAFEDALQLALTDFNLETVSSALVGTVDNAVLPLAAHRHRLEIDAITPMAEASHWLWLTRDRAEQATLSIAAVHSACDRADLFSWIEAQNLDASSLALSAGQYLSPEDFAAVQARTVAKHAFDYRTDRGYYASQSAATITAFASEPNDAVRTLLHVNGDPLGRYAAMLIRK
jgi:hypothetical protein